MTSTTVTFPIGAVSGVGTITRVVPLPPREGIGAVAGVVVDTTPFHPVDHAWPDQPADRGTLAEVDLVDCVTGVVGSDGRLLVGDDISVRRGEPGWDWVVVHVLPAEDAVGPHIVPDGPVALTVDAGLRHELSRGHTACHVAALALNKVCAPRWSKPVERMDSLGHPDLDQMALQESRILPDGAVDRYRLGRSIRKRGLPTEALLADLPAIQDHVNGLLLEEIAANGAVVIETEGDTLDAMRRWTAELRDGWASIPCGGTHVTHLGELGEVTVALEPTQDGFDMTTTVVPRA